MVSEDQKIRDKAFARERRLRDEAQIRYEGKEEGRKEGRKEGRAEGRQTEKNAIALNMLHKGMDFTLIAELTGLSLTQIKQLKDTSTHSSNSIS